jgi:lysozyme
MKASSKALELIKQFEGLRLKAYLCPGGVWTIGYGHTSGVKSGMVITKAQAEEYLLSDIAVFE